jgi:hypothetical protein
LGVEQPLLTVALFGGPAIAAYRLSLGLTAERSRLTVVFGRTCLFIANFGFWIGSLWGDALRVGADDMGRGDAVIPDWLFAFAWALALLAAVVWGVRRNRRAVVNIAAVFGAIHFCTVLRAPRRVTGLGPRGRRARSGDCARPDPVQPAAPAPA